MKDKSEKKDESLLFRRVTPNAGKNRKIVFSPDGRSTGDFSSNKKRASSTMKPFIRNISPFIKKNICKGRLNEIALKYSFSKAEIKVYEKMCLYFRTLPDFEKAQTISQMLKASIL